MITCLTASLERKVAISQEGGHQGDGQRRVAPVVRSRRGRRRSLLAGAPARSARMNGGPPRLEPTVRCRPRVHSRRGDAEPQSWVAFGPIAPRRAGRRTGPAADAGRRSVRPGAQPCVRNVYRRDRSRNHLLPRRRESNHPHCLPVTAADSAVSAPPQASAAADPSSAGPQGRRPRQLHDQGL